METKSAQKYLYKKILESFKNCDWKVVDNRYNLSGSKYSTNDVFGGSYYDDFLINEDLKMYLVMGLSEDKIRHIVEGKHKEYIIEFKFRPDKESILGYWYKDGGEIKTSNIHLDINFLQRKKLKRSFKKMIKNVYQTKYQKTFSHSVSKYMERNKDIFRDHRIDEILEEQ